VDHSGKQTGNQYLTDNSIVCLEMLFLVILYLLKHFKVKYAAATKKALVVHFLKNNLYFQKMVALRSKIMTFLRWRFSYFP
jgi:hypothetical protein